MKRFALNKSQRCTETVSFDRKQPDQRKSTAYAVLFHAQAIPAIFFERLAGYNGVMDTHDRKSDTPLPPSEFWIEKKAPEVSYEFFIFELDGELYAVLVSDILQVMKIPPITPVPNAPRAIAGIFHSRGKVVVVLDLLMRIGLRRMTALVPGYLFILARQQNYFGILVDQTKLVARIPETEIQEASPVILAHISPEYIKGVFFYADGAGAYSRPHGRHDDFMIKPKNEEDHGAEEVHKTRPVLWLNIAALLDEADLRTMILRQDPPHGVGE